MTDKLLEKTWERIQQKTFTKWCNMHLGKRGKAIENIDEDFKSGINLILLLEVIGAESLGKYNQKPVMKIHNIENINRALKYIADKGVKLWGIAAEDIFDGNRKLILGMIWTIILRFAIADISEEELSAKEALLLWCKKKTTGYKDVQVDNFSNSWQDGLAFCALIHAHRPDLIDFDSLSNADPARNLQIAFDVAEKDLGIPKLLDIEDIIDVPKPDERSIMTYISQFYHYFSANRKQEIAGRRIGKLVDMTVSNDQLKNDYNQKAAVHAAWVKSATDKLNERDFDNTLAGIKQRLAEFRQFRSEEKPPKVADKLALENLANSIALKLSHANRPPFQPQAGCSTNELNQAWDALNAAEAARAADLLAELERQEGLDVLKRRFNNKATQLEDWLGKKSDYLQSEESVDTVNAAQRALIVLDAFNEELERSRARLEAVNGLAGKITEQNDKDSAAVQARADAINAAFANLRNLSDSKRASLNNKLGDQKDRESLRMKFAEAATAYKTWVNETTSAASATAFPNTLEGVENFKATLDAQDAEINGQNDSKRDNLGSIWNEIQQLNIKDNRYTVLTFDDINALHQSVVEVLAKRQSDYAAELQRQIELEAKRKEFARAAQEFVDSLAQRRAALEALQGEPLDLIESIKGTYAEGQPDKEKLAAVGELQAELSRLGVADNRHTQLTLPILEVHQSQLAKFVRNRIASLQQEANLKQQYHQRASDLLAWINATLPTINAGAFDNTLEGARAIKNAWNEYKTTVRAQKGVEKINIEGLFNKIAENQASHNRPAFVPDAGKAIADINALWSQLEEQEKQRETAIYNELSRQEKLFALVKNFNSEADDLEAWAAKQKVYLTAQEDVSTLDDARLKLVNLSVYEEDYNNTQTRLNQVQALKDEINALNYNDVATINARADSLKQLWAELQQLADSKRASLDKSLAEQQTWENMRLAFASAATEFQQFVKDTIENISERNFGTTLNDVESTAATLQQEDSSIRADAERKLQTAQQAWADLQSNNVADNRYTDLTVGDLQTSNGDLEAALASRQADYQTELARQRENDAQSQSFAAKTQAFSDWLSSQLKEIRAIQGTTDERTAKINEAYAEGRPAQSQLDDLIVQDNGLRERGIYYNRYLVHTIPSLQKALQQFNESVSNLLAAIDEEREFNERRQTQEAEWKQKEAIEERGVHFHNAVQDLNLFLDSVYEILTDPINVNSVEGAEKLIADFNEARDQVNGKEGDFQQVLKDGAELKDLVAGVEASTSAIQQKWNSTQDNIRTRDESLQASLATQRRNDELCQHFAQKAQTFSDFINNTKSALSENSAGNIEERLAAVRAIGAQFAEGNAQLEELSQLSERIIEASITANRHTNLTLPELKAQYDELKSSQKDREALLDKELLQEKHSTATPEQIEEFKEVFRHFDRDNKGFLTALQFKSCLQSLGNDPTDADMDRLMGALGQDKPNPSGGDAIKAVEFDRFVEHMIKVTSDTTTQGEIAQSFRDLAGDKDFITEADLRRGLPGDKVDYLIANMPRYEGVADGYDYNAWAASAFSR